MKFIFNQLLLLTFLIPFFAIANMSGNAQKSNTDLHKTTLTVAIETIGYFPYIYTENGEIKGFTIDLLNYIEKHSTYNFKFVTLPWARALYLVEQGKVDLIPTLFKNAQREKVYHFITPSYGYEVNQLFTLSDKAISFNEQLQQLTPYSIGTKREFSYGEKFDQASFLTKIPALNEDVLLKLILSKRVDMAIVNPYIFKQLILKNNAADKVKAITPYVDKTPVYLGLTKRRHDSEKINATLGQLTEKFKASAYYQKLLTQYQLHF